MVAGNTFPGEGAPGHARASRQERRSHRRRRHRRSLRRAGRSPTGRRRRLFHTYDDRGGVPGGANGLQDLGCPGEPEAGLAEHLCAGRQVGGDARAVGPCLSGSSSVATTGMPTRAATATSQAIRSTARSASAARKPGCASTTTSTELSRSINPIAVILPHPPKRRASSQAPLPVALEHLPATDSPQAHRTPVLARARTQGPRSPGMSAICGYERTGSSGQMSRRRGVCVSCSPTHDQTRGSAWRSCGSASHEALSKFSASGAVCSGCGGPLVSWRLIWLGRDVPPRPHRLRQWILRVIEAWRPRMNGR